MKTKTAEQSRGAGKIIGIVILTSLSFVACAKSSNLTQSYIKSPTAPASPPAAGISPYQPVVTASITGASQYTVNPFSVSWTANLSSAAYSSMCGGETTGCTDFYISTCQSGTTKCSGYVGIHCDIDGENCTANSYIAGYDNAVWGTVAVTNNSDGSKIYTYIDPNSNDAPVASGDYLYIQAVYDIPAGD